MKKKLLSILLLLLSCTSKEQNDIVIHDLNVDFPMADTIAMEQKQTFEVPYYAPNFAVKDTIFFALGYNKDNMGYCYSINNGNLLTPIINIGRAVNEVVATDNNYQIMFHRDSIQFNLASNEIKSIAMNDIVIKPFGERVVSKINTPKGISSFSCKKIDNNIVVGHIFDAKDGQKYFICDSGKLKLFGKYNEKVYESNANQKLSSNILSMVHRPNFANHGSKIISVDQTGILLELIDANAKEVVKDRFYTILDIKEMNERGGTPPTPDFNTKGVYCTDKEIYCIVTQLDKVKTKEKKEKFVDLFILVFDWDLNPIKKYYIGSSTSRGYQVYMSADCRKFYYLAKEEGEKQTLFEGIIN